MILGVLAVRFSGDAGVKALENWDAAYGREFRCTANFKLADDVVYLYFWKMPRQRSLALSDGVSAHHADKLGVPLTHLLGQAADGEVSIATMPGWMGRIVMDAMGPDRERWADAA